MIQSGVTVAVEPDTTADALACSRSAAARIVRSAAESPPALLVVVVIHRDVRNDS
ncbi:MAG TPA: hypothetical protein VKY31_02860 [Terriglobia bacterium]|nr:hypothetical protein [Terriglobia bacterium]